MVQRIMVATDGSSGAKRALDAAAALARDLACELLIVTIGGNLSGPELRRLARSEGGVGEALEMISDQVLDEATKRARRIGAGNVKRQMAWGDPAEVLIDVALRKKADMLVVGRRGRGRLSGLLLGSVSQKLVTLAPCPVTVVP